MIRRCTPRNQETKMDLTQMTDPADVFLQGDAADSAIDYRKDLQEGQ